MKRKHGEISGAMGDGCSTNTNERGPNGSRDRVYVPGFGFLNDGGSVPIKRAGIRGERGESDRSERRDEYLSTLQVQCELCMIFLIHH